jgi:hypothetical protein
MTGPASSSREQALAEILQIIEANNLDAADILKMARNARKDVSRSEPGRRANLGPLVLRVFYYLGGTLVFAGLGIYIQTVWHDLTSVQRVLVTLGSGFVAYLMGIIFARNPDLEKAATPAHILAFVLQPVGISVLLKEFFHGNDTALGAMIIFGPLAVQQELTFLSLKRPSLLLFTLLYIYGFVGAATVYFDFDRGISAVACGMFLYLMAVDMRRKQAYRDLTPLFFTLGSGLMLAGLYYHLGRTIYDPLVLALCLGFLMHAVLTESRMLYVMSLLYVAGYFCGGLGGRWGWSTYHRHYDELTAVFAGTSLVLTGHWLNRSSFISASPVWFFVGTSCALGGAYSMLYDTAGAPLFVGVATIAIYAALMLRSRAMLAAAILGLLGFVAAYTERHFAHSVSWPLLLILFGFLLLLAGFAFARLSGRIREPSTQKTLA